jgi:hypothetical protein
MTCLCGGARLDNPRENQPVNIPPELTLAALRKEFPRYQIWLEQARGQYRFVARRTDPGDGPHTLVTGSLAELRTTLGRPA